MAPERWDIGGLGMFWFCSWGNHCSGFFASCQSQRLSVREVSDMNALSSGLWAGASLGRECAARVLGRHFGLVK